MRPLNEPSCYLIDQVFFYIISHAVVKMSLFRTTSCSSPASTTNPESWRRTCTSLASPDKSIPTAATTHTRIYRPILEATPLKAVDQEEAQTSTPGVTTWKFLLNWARPSWQALPVGSRNWFILYSSTLPESTSWQLSSLHQTNWIPMQVLRSLSKLKEIVSCSNNVTFQSNRYTFIAK